jgi:DNA-binding beta-propeller fold protein YncE/cytochrome c peroxidase
LSAAEGHVYVAGATGRTLIAVDATTGEAAAPVPLSGEATGIAATPDKALLYVTGRAAAGFIDVIERDRGTVSATYRAGHSPTAPVISPDGTRLFVCDRFNHRVLVFALPGMEELARIPVTREPVAAAITPDGQRLLVVNLLPAVRSNESYVAAAVDVIDVPSLQALPPILLPNGSTGLHGIGLSPDGRYAYVTHILARYQLPTTQLERGWINTNAVSVLDVAAHSLVNAFLLDEVDQGAANPWGIACTEDGLWLAVAHAGTHEISIIDRGQLHEKLAAAQEAGEAHTVPNDLAFLVGLRTRNRLSGRGPRALAAVGTRLYTTEYFSDSLGVLDLQGETPAPAHSWALAAATEPGPVRRGELYFNDATLCFQQWQSCASCHPGDARVDGLNWDLLNDGMGNPKNAKSMLYSHQTPPSMASGVRDAAETAVRAGIRHILFRQPDEEVATSIDAYLEALKPVPSPHLAESGGLSAAAERGKAVFEAARCASCHPVPLFTNMKSYDVGTGQGRDQYTLFDTPTLIEVWRTAPYLHDGRAMDMMEALTTFNIDDRHGTTSTLSPDELKDLIEYVLSL